MASASSFWHPRCGTLSCFAFWMQDLIQSATPGRVAGFIHETIQGVGGAVPLADGYLPEAYRVGGRCWCRAGLQAAAPLFFPCMPAAHVWRLHGAAVHGCISAMQSGDDACYLILADPAVPPVERRAPAHPTCQAAVLSPSPLHTHAPLQVPSVVSRPLHGALLQNQALPILLPTS